MDYIFFKKDNFKVVTLATDGEAVSAAQKDKTVVRVLRTKGSVEVYSLKGNNGTGSTKSN